MRNLPRRRKAPSPWRDPEGALLLLGEAVVALAQYRVALEPGWLPRGKDLLARLREVDPEAARLVTDASQGPVEKRIAAGRLLCLHVTGFPGFFEWTSPQEPAEPAKP
ncbi:MAG TPA: hypothetical protein VG944_11490 [Fimbriimonas sp.]|nr:hypothetical protein [Fimbriimonas sp.]